MKRGDFSSSEQFDEHIAALIQRTQQRQLTGQSLADEPETRMTNDLRHAYQAEEQADARSLERVLSRLVDDSAQVEPKLIFLPQVHQNQERMPYMQNTTQSFSDEIASKKKSRWGRRLGLFAAVLCLLALVGGFLTVLNATHPGNAPNTSTASHQTQTATQVPTIKSGPVGTIIFQGKVQTAPMSWSPQGNRVAGLGSDMTPETWDGLTNTNVMKYQVPFEHTALAMMATAWSVDGNSVVFAYLNGIAVFNAQTGALLHSWTAKQNYSFQTLALSADNKYLVTTSFFHPSNTSKAIDAHLNVFSLSSGQLVAQPASGPYTNLYWSPDGKYLAAGGVSEAGGQSVSWQLWNPTNWQIEHTYTAADFSWSPDGSQIALVKNGGVQIVKTAQDTIVRSFAGGNGFVGAISWQPHGNRLLVETLTDNARTSTLSLWNTQNGALLYTFTAYHGAFNNGEAWSSDGKYVLFSVFQTIDKKSGPPTMTPGVQEWYEVIWIAE